VVEHVVRMLGEAEHKVKRGVVRKAHDFLPAVELSFAAKLGVKIVGSEETLTA
jgi:hypothetical protein